MNLSTPSTLPNLTYISLRNTIEVKIKNESIIISQLELQVAFKEKVLKSQKDLEDAKHIRNVAKEILNEALIKEYEGMLDGFY